MGIKQAGGEPRRRVVKVMLDHYVSQIKSSRISATKRILLETGEREYHRPH